MLDAVLMTITFQLQPTAMGTHMTYICTLEPQIPAPMSENQKRSAVKSELARLRLKEAYEKIGELVLQT